MFIAVYTFKVKPGMEQQFRQAWAELTLEIRRDCKSLGSRLHKDEDGKYIGYAQWPSRQAWEEASINDSIARTKMRESLHSLETIYRLEVVNDLLSGQED